MTFLRNWTGKLVSELFGYVTHADAAWHARPAHG